MPENNMETEFTSEGIMKKTTIIVIFVVIFIIVALLSLRKMGA